VRRFVCDDAHIFAAHSQIESEMRHALQFMSDTYALFGFNFTFELSTRPEKSLGSREMWDRAEKALENVLNEFAPGKWKLNPGDGAFYGPKIDVHVSDSLARTWQCATVQLDFNLPERFQLEYQADSSDLKRPVIIHRAIYGSVERFMAILTEHYAGKWPFWLSPRQVMVVPVAADADAYARETRDLLYAEGFEAEVDLSDATLPKKVALAQTAQFNYILVVGRDEIPEQKVAVRVRDDKNKEIMGRAAFVALCHQLAKDHK